MLVRRFPRRIAALPAIFEFVAEFGTSQGISEDQRYDVDLIIEELFTDFVKYNAGGVHDISIGLDRGDGHLTITLEDYDVEPFDVSMANQDETGAATLRAGGRGLRLVRRVADDLRYNYHDRNSTITVTKRLDD
jgi:anti-sigma regulatory factor (Ser/Thr protein kinase)